MSATEETLRLLRSIDTTLKTLLTLSQRRTPAAAKEIASDRDLDSKYGDPVIKFNPRDWSGDSFKGCRMSQCPAPFLELLAETFDYFADKAEQNNEQTDKGKPVAGCKRKDAARARGWAKRNRAVHPTPTQAQPAGASEPDGWESDSSEGPDPWNVTADEIFSRR